MSALRIVALSDTHSLHEQVRVPDGDVLIHAGDFMNSGLDVKEVLRFARWFSSHPHRVKILVAGNHDILFEKFGSLARSLLGSGIEYLETSSVWIDPDRVQASAFPTQGPLIWGCPVTPAFNNWAFNRTRGPEIARYWSMIPEETDILVTHGPPFAILDQISSTEPEPLGCQELRISVESLKTPLHIFGHIHGSAGVLRTQGTLFCNAAVLDNDYNPTRDPLILDYDAHTRVAAHVEV